MDDYELSMRLGESLSDLIRSYRGCEEIMRPDATDKIRGIDTITKINFKGLEMSIDRIKIYLLDIDKHINLSDCILHGAEPPSPEEIYAKLGGVTEDDKLLLADDAATIKELAKPIVMVVEIFEHLKQITEIANELKKLENTDFL